MFRIRKEQKAAFREDAIHDFENRMVAHVRRCLVEHWETLGDDALREVIRMGTERADGFGIVAERDVCKFVDLMLVFGTDFDRRCAWAREILEAAAPTDPAVKMRRLFQRAGDEK